MHLLVYLKYDRCVINVDGTSEGVMVTSSRSLVLKNKGQWRKLKEGLVFNGD